MRIQIKNKLLERMPKGKTKTTSDNKTLSELELLKRSKHLLTQSESKWTDHQKELVLEIFEKFPQLKKPTNSARILKAGTIQPTTTTTG